MRLGVDEVRRQSRQIALPDVGVEGQTRIAAAEVALVGEDLAVETARTYLEAAGVRRTRAVAAAADGAACVEALRGAALVVRSGFDDDPLLRAAAHLGIPAVVLRAGRGAVDLLSFRQHRPVAAADLDVPVRAAEAPAGDRAAAVLAGALAAAEALWILIDPGRPPRARHLRIPLDGGEPLAQEIPW